MPKRIDMRMLAVDLAEVLSSEEYEIDVDENDVERGLVAFLETIAPGSVIDNLRYGTRR
jgi:uncharacterized protein YjbK